MKGIRIHLTAAVLCGGLWACNSSQDVVSTSAPAPIPPVAESGELQVKVLSNRADLISGDDALVEVLLPDAAVVPSVQVQLNGSDISEQFALRPNGRYMGLVTGLQLGENSLSAVAEGATASAPLIVNHPNSGPIFSAPPPPRRSCQEGAVDEFCNQPAQYSYLYKSTDPTVTALQPYDPASPPSDVATATTDDGQTLPFIVREELGYQNRDQYKILMLYQPDLDWQPWAPQPQWNRKLLIPHGGNCGISYTPGSAPLNDYSGTIPETPLFEQSYITALGRGFGVLSAALANTGHNCDVVLGAEALMMAKERFVEQYGELRYTIGTGCSGGSIAQATIANAYPGIYQGLLTMCSYPDSLSAGLQFADYHLMRLYFEDPSRWAQGVVWLPTQWGDVEGHITHVNAIAADELLFKAATNPEGDCFGEQSYNAATNPGGYRCSILDGMTHIFGLREPAVWTPMEQAAGRGFPAIPLGNNGVQYGLVALQRGTITPAQFVDLNVKIGGLSVDAKPQPERTVADSRAVANAFGSGAINRTNNMHSVAIINFVGPDPGIAHDSVHAWWTRWRLDREQGHHDNHVMWAGPAPLIGDLNYVYQGLTAMDRWLSAIEQDNGPAPLSEKIITHKPADVHDQCSDGAGHKILDDLCVDVVLPVYAYGTPRTLAGDGITGDSFECTLKPFNRADNYGLVPFTEAEWQQLETLFVNGVCDYSQPQATHRPTTAWLGYQTAGKVVVGGSPLPAPPANSGDGWAAPPFRY